MRPDRARDGQRILSVPLYQVRRGAASIRDHGHYRRERGSVHDRSARRGPGAAPADPDPLRLRHGLAGHRRLRHGARAAAAAVPDRHPGRGGRAWPGCSCSLPKAWDVLVNPVAGRLSDRTRTRWGARRPYLLVGGLALAVLFAAIFAGVFTGPAGAVWVCVAFLAAATAFAFFQVPYVAMPAEMTEGGDLTDPYGERTRMMTWRVAFLALTILVSGAVAPIVVTMFGGGIPGHRAMGVFIAADHGRRHGERLRPHARRRHRRRGRQRAVAAGPAAGRRGEPAVPGAGRLLRRAGGRGRRPCWPASSTSPTTSCTTTAPRRCCSSASSARPFWSCRCGTASARGSASSRGTCSRRSR